MIKVHFHVTPRKLRDPISQKLNFSLRKREGEYTITKKLLKSPPNNLKSNGSASRSPHLAVESGYRGWQHLVTFRLV